MVQINQEEIECYTYDQIIAGSSIVEAWLKEAVWSRAFVLSIIGNLPNLTAVTNRMSQIPIEYYNTLRGYWGDRLAQQFADYINRRIAIKGNLLNAILRNDPSASDTYTRELYANADEIAAFLAQFPGWERNVWQALLYDEINMYLRQIESILNSNYSTELSIFDSIINHTVNMGNYMAYGILRRRYT